jgi:hypothetical protein
MIFKFKYCDLIVRERIYVVDLYKTIKSAKCEALI